MGQLNFAGKKTYKKKNRQKKSPKNKNKTKKVNTAKFKKMVCAPKQRAKVDSEMLDFSCYSTKTLRNFKRIWNSEHPEQQITVSEPLEIWSFFKNNLKEKCYNELCWLNNLPLDSEIDKNEMAETIFRPYSPREWNDKPSTWLSSDDIIKVMKQYTNKYKNFAFIGPSPIDFDTMELRDTCVYKKLCKFNLEKYYVDSDITKIGIIFNLDKHNMPGSHWVSLFVDLDKKFIFYFDSNGVRIPKQINALKNRIVKQAADLNIKLKYYTNYDIVHQKKDGQCGMYCLFFIVQLLRENKTPTYFLKNRVTDESMEDYRLKYFNSKVEV